MGKFNERALKKREALKKPTNMSKLKECQHILKKIRITQKHPDEEEMEVIRKKVNEYHKLTSKPKLQIKIGTVITYFRDERKRLKDNDELEDDSTTEIKTAEQLNALQKLHEETKGTEEWKKRYAGLAEKVGLPLKFVRKWFYRKEANLRSDSLPKMPTRANPTLNADSDDDNESSDGLSELDNDSDEDKENQDEASDDEKNDSDEEKEADDVNIDQGHHLPSDEEMEMDEQVDEQPDHHDSSDEEMEDEQVDEGQDHQDTSDEEMKEEPDEERQDHPDTSDEEMEDEQDEERQDHQSSAHEEEDMEQEIQESDNQDSSSADDTNVENQQNDSNSTMNEIAPSPPPPSNPPAVVENHVVSFEPVIDFSTVVLKTDEDRKTQVMTLNKYLDDEIQRKNGRKRGCKSEYANILKEVEEQTKNLLDDPKLDNIIGIHRIFKKNLEKATPDGPVEEPLLPAYEEVKKHLSAGLCCGENREYTPVNLECSNAECFGSRCYIKRGEVYYSCQNRTEKLSYCEKKCEEKKKKISILKRHHDLAPEHYEQCDSCDRFWHSPCRIEYLRVNKKTCVCKQEKDEKIDTCYIQKLPKSKMTDFMEEFVNSGDPKHPPITICLTMVKDCNYELENPKSKVSQYPNLLSYFQNSHNPPKLEFKKKQMFAFMDVAGVPQTIFGLEVNEFTATSSKKGWIDIAYLDSVKMFGPQKLRSEIFRKIILAYFKYASKTHAKGHIYACPPVENEDFLLTGHIGKYLEQQFLNKWYRTLLKDGETLHIVRNVENVMSFIDKFGSDVPTLINALSFHGEFWLEEINSILGEHDDDEEILKAIKEAAADKDGNFFYFDFVTADPTANTTEVTECETEKILKGGEGVGVPIQHENNWEFGTRRSNLHGTFELTKHVVKEYEEKKKEFETRAATSS